MTTPYLQGTGAVPEATALLLRGIQTDAYGEVLGGHKAIFDPLQSGLTTTIPNGGSLANIVAGGAAAGPAVGIISSGSSIAAAKGLRFSNSAANTEYLPLPSPFDLRTLGSEPSIVISAWITNDVDTSSAYPVIMGHAYQGTTYHQWTLQHRNTSGKLAFTVNMTRHEFVAPIGVPMLVTAHIKRTAAGAFAFTTYLDDAVVGATTGMAYPFNNPAGSAYAMKAIGFVGGYNSEWIGTVHRLQLLKVDPAFDITGWLAEEIAANAARWA